MSELTSKFSREDIETLIQSIDDWETMGNSEFHVMQMFKNVPMPHEDHEGFQALSMIKDHFRGKEKNIMAGRVIRQEKATFIKAKLMLLRQDMQINKIFDYNPETEDTSNCVVPKSGDLQSKLDLAEKFIHDLAVDKHYQEFLEREKNS